ncbi:deoxynucleoside triphosphate triphosphohydrolase SAMHD1 [Biomphalaria pfeifferi]|uniref:Deoxynucleoside triphosphate triphosphohydrolase SAMHD1 n=1 Tax=Biomphalaria pfeifferi TaxID=112525 RepID=A0AAD8BXR1_BIOPF|nr:deoxynucleoside triphosphate triphosphohydrolase SAMHD1 [Biomphalaria pfeifferi]
MYKKEKRPKIDSSLTNVSNGRGTVDLSMQENEVSILHKNNTNGLSYSQELVGTSFNENNLNELNSCPESNGVRLNGTHMEELSPCFEPHGANNSIDMIDDQMIDGLKSEDVVKLLLENPEELKNVTIDSLMQMGVKTFRDCIEIMESLDSLGIGDTLEEKNSKVFNDPIHGLIKLHPACLAIIDTPQFQRLRCIKQLGMCYYVYPGASHNRFEHSLGVCYLAGQFARTLQKNQPYLGITDKDILCVEIAGLCHDLGHGPFSHLFDGKFIPAVCPTRKWKHEKASLDMLDFLIEENQLLEPKGLLSKYGLDMKDILFIKEQIYGPIDNSVTLKGRDKEKYFLYEIVSNKRNGIDVDKWDYFARDCHHLGVKNNFDHFRFMKFARVIKVNEEWQICTRDKEIGNLYNMFYTRYTLHRTAYQHKVSNAIETMILHALIKANDYVQFTKKDGTQCKMSECIDDMLAYTELTDNILFKIIYMENTAAEVQEAKNIIQRVFTRDLYTCVYESIPLESKDFHKTADEIRKAILNKANELFGVTYKSTDAVVEVTYLDFGMKHQNPVEKLLVYSKHEENSARHLPKSEASRILGPMTFSELLIRVYSCDRDKVKCQVLDKAAKAWFEDMQSGWNQTISTPEKKKKEELSLSMQLTPSSAGKHKARYSSLDME